MGVLLSAVSVQAETGTIKGVVHFKGEVPTRVLLPTDKDPQCAKSKEKIGTYNYIVNNNETLRNVLVSIDHDFDQKFESPSDPVILDQFGCEYNPHVFGMMSGQVLEIRNSDDTLHNIHALAQKNPAFNVSQPKKNMTKTVDNLKREETFKVKCDVHPWMGCYIGVFDHPFFDVTGKDGDFTLKDVPAGTYKVKAFHEEEGEQSQEITVVAGEEATVEFTFEYSGK
jgi:plastocyanin